MLANACNEVPGALCGKNVAGLLLPSFTVDGTHEHDDSGPCPPRIQTCMLEAFACVCACVCIHV
eukprot:10761854-Alexandrium_andersonii.AAC.1